MPTLADRRHLIATAPSLRVEVWADELVEAHGHDPRAPYALRYWLPTVGPSCLLAARVLLDGLAASPQGYDIAVVALGQTLGPPGNGGSHARITRPLARLAAFELAIVPPTATPLYRVRRAWPPLTQ